MRSGTCCWPSSEIQAATAVALIASVVVFAPVAVVADVDPRVWPFVAATSLLQLLYFALLGAAYRRADLSLVYPIARGLAPVLVLLVGTLAVSQGASTAQAIGVLVIAGGVLLVRGPKGRADPLDGALALAIADCIAAYTLDDKHGVQYATPLVYL